MRILNTKNPDDAIRLTPWYVATERDDRISIAAQVYQRLLQKPEDTFVLIAIERDIARAMLVAHVSDASKKVCWLWQVRLQPGFSEGELLFDAVKSWAKAKGCREIRTGVNGRKKAFERKWGFKPIRDEMRFKLR